MLNFVGPLETCIWHAINLCCFDIHFYMGTLREFDNKGKGLISIKLKLHFLLGRKAHNPQWNLFQDKALNNIRKYNFFLFLAWRKAQTDISETICSCFPINCSFASSPPFSLMVYVIKCHFLSSLYCIVLLALSYFSLQVFCTFLSDKNTTFIYFKKFLSSIFIYKKVLQKKRGTLWQ